MNRVPF